jgi:hypothetical protein
VRTRQVRLAARPVGEPRDSDFELTHADLSDLAEGQVLLRTIYLSLDPYMRGRMSDAASYADPVPLGEVMVGHQDLTFVSIELHDEQGQLVTGSDIPVTIDIDGPAVLAGMCSANPKTNERFDANTWTTFDGRALAVVRATGVGSITITASASGLASTTLKATASPRAETMDHDTSKPRGAS